MAEEYSFFNSVDGDREYEADEFAKFFRQFLTSGLFYTNGLPALKVSHVSGLKTKVEAGSALLEGYQYRNTSDLELTHAAADITNPRIDRVVIRLDRSVASRYVKVFVKKGTPATNPAPPALQRDQIIFEVSLAQVRINAGSAAISTVSDERFDLTVAGVVTAKNLTSTVYVSDTEPVAPKAGDIWVDTR
ncbi:hypothetical protein [Brevibacillus choshinensis]|uniref:Phage tail protein n=1 Tax=Brevibacillus choshinensis TaxID=54911 RepID=A0ABX7FL22_BRECH|nr:hypothetical protein [Brevibacillus choshinensis]QRG66928.1 hypothetical protein JNE38_26195 [Brevibacillus choshinensis]